MNNSVLSSIFPLTSGVNNTDPSIDLQKLIIQKQAEQQQVQQQAIVQQQLQSQMAQQAAAMPNGQGYIPQGINKDVWSNASSETQQRIKDMAAMQAAMAPPKVNPILGGLGMGLMIAGQGLSGKPFVNEFYNAQDANQKANMENMAKMMGNNSTVPIIQIGADGKPTTIGDMPKGSKVINSSTNSRSLTPDQAKNVATRIMSGKAAPSEFSKYQIGQISAFLPPDFDMIGAENSYKANQSAMQGVKVQDAKVNLANNIMTTFKEAYDPKTDTYNIPPSQHLELAMNYAKMQSPNGVIAQDLVNQLTQGTAREKMAKIAIYFGADPKEIGGSTQSVLKWFRDNTDAQAKMAVATRAQYQQGKVSDYIGKDSSVQIPTFDAAKEARYQAWKASQK